MSVLLMRATQMYLSCRIVRCHIQQKKKTSAQPYQKKKVTVTGDSMLNIICEKDLSRAHNVKVTNFPSGTSDKIVENLDDLIEKKPGDLAIHIRTNDLTNNVKLLNNVKKILKKVSVNAPLTNLAFSSINVRKDNWDYRKIHSRHKCTLKKFLHAKCYWIY